MEAPVFAADQHLQRPVAVQVGDRGRASVAMPIETAPQPGRMAPDPSYARTLPSAPAMITWSALSPRWRRSGASAGDVTRPLPVVSSSRCGQPGSPLPRRREEVEAVVGRGHRHFEPGDGGRLRGDVPTAGELLMRPLATSGHPGSAVPFRSA